MSASDDQTKIDALFKYIKVREKVEIRNHLRLGKVGNESSRRPIKIELKNSEMAALILSNAKLLRPLNQKLFFKADKTAKEREEYQRLLKKKEELVLAHPTEDGSESRVVLKKGVLTVDGVVRDRYKTPQTIF